MDELDRAAPLFEGAIPFRVLADGREARACELTLRFLEGARAAPAAPGQGARVLHVEVADEADAFFLHSLTVGEAEYGELRHDQALLVDFAGFAPHLLALLRAATLCKGDAQPK